MIQTHTPFCLSASPEPRYRSFSPHDPSCNAGVRSSWSAAWRPRPPSPHLLQRRRGLHLISVRSLPCPAVAGVRAAASPPSRCCSCSSPVPLLPILSFPRRAPWPAGRAPWPAVLRPGGSLPLVACRRRITTRRRSRYGLRLRPPQRRSATRESSIPSWTAVGARVGWLGKVAGEVGELRLRGI